MVHFLKYTKIYFLISAVIIGIGLYSIMQWGFGYSIDFVGGTNMEYQFSKPTDRESLVTILTQNKVEFISITQKGDVYLIRTKAIDEKKESALKKSMEARLGSKITVLRSETVGPILGKEMVQKTIIASVIAIFGILIYMSFAFRNVNFAIAAIAAMFHDFLVVVGMYSILCHFFGAEVDTLFVTALLTTMAFSVHDTIVIFDKIREHMRNEGTNGDISVYANRALTETLVRSFNNSMTIIFMLLALTLLGGTTIKFFVATLLIGTITGTYSSPFIATPILIFLEKRKK